MDNFKAPHETEKEALDSRGQTQKSSKTKIFKNWKKNVEYAPVKKCHLQIFLNEQHLLLLIDWYLCYCYFIIYK